MYDLRNRINKYYDSHVVAWRRRYYKTYYAVLYPSRFNMYNIKQYNVVHDAHTSTIQRQKGVEIIRGYHELSEFWTSERGRFVQIFIRLFNNYVIARRV